MQHIELLGASGLGLGLGQEERIVGWGDDLEGIGIGELRSLMGALGVDERIVGWGGLGNLGETPTVGKCPSSLSMGTKFTGDILGIPWPMKISSKLAGGSLYGCTPEINQLTISKAKTPALLATLIERNLSWFLPRTLEDFPDMLYKPTDLLKIAKVRGGFYAGKANFDKYREYLGKDLAMPKYTMAEGIVNSGPRLFAVMTTIKKALPMTCNGAFFMLEERIVVLNDLGSTWGVGLYNPPDKSLFEKVLSPIVSLTSLIIKLITKTVDLVKAGIEALIQLFKNALAMFCKLAQSTVAKLLDGYIKKLGSLETQIAEGKATTTSGTVSAQATATTQPGTIATSDVAYYNSQLKSISQKLCLSTPTLPPPTAEEPKSLLPYFLVGGGVLTAATLAAVGIKRRR